MRRCEEVHTFFRELTRKNVVRGGKPTGALRLTVGFPDGARIATIRMRAILPFRRSLRYEANWVPHRRGTLLAAFHF